MVMAFNMLLGLFLKIPCYFFREETFQREIMCGLLNAQEGDFLLWNIERTITKIYIPVLLDSCMGDKGKLGVQFINFMSNLFSVF